MNILITGGAGFVGGNLAIHLAEEGHRVTVMDNLVRRGSEINIPRLKAHGVEFRHGDIRCPEDWKGLSADYVLECAAQPSAIDGYNNPTYDFTNNTVSVLHTLDFCRANGAGLVFWSTNKVYPVSHVNRLCSPSVLPHLEAYTGGSIDERCSLDGGDRSLYGASKVMADLMIQEWSEAFGIPAYINRFSCLYGPWQWGKSEQGWVAWWVIAHILGLPLKYIGFEGKQVRDALHVKDVCRLVSLQINRPTAKSNVYNIGGGRANALSLRKCTKLCESITGNKVAIETEEAPRRADFAYYVSEIFKAKEELGWSPLISIDEGLSDVAAWVNENLPTIKALYGP